MHDCQKFREDWVSGISRGTPDCDGCCRFCEEAAVIFRVFEPSTDPVPALSAEQWMAFEGRLRTNLGRKHASGGPASRKEGIAVLAAVAAVAIAVTWGNLRVSQSLVEGTASRPVTRHIEFGNDHIQGLDPVVVDFLRRSELFLRSFTKIKPSYVQDIDDARRRASDDLDEILERKEETGSFAPVRIALEEYESVLRDIKNLESPDEIGDIQLRIQRNGLIANLKAYQPQVILVSRR